MGGFLEVTWKICKLLLGFGIFFAVCYIIASIANWWDSWKTRHDRTLKSFTLFFPGIMTAEKLKELLDDINAGIKGEKYTDVDRIDIKDVVSITALPYTDGVQYTVWYEERPIIVPKPKSYNSYNQGAVKKYQDQRLFKE